MRRKARAAVTVLAASLAGTAAIPAVANATPASVTVTVEQGGLNAPRHLVLTRMGLVVTESGAVSPVGASNCATGPATEGAGTSQFCTSSTGAIFTISPGGQATSVLTELPSVTEEAIGEVTGASAIAYGHGQEAVTIDDFLVNKDGSNSLLPKPFASAFGTLRLVSHGKSKAIDLAAFAAAHPQLGVQSRDCPGRGAVRLRPIRRDRLPRGWESPMPALNHLLYVSARGRVSMLARFPAVAEQVPAVVFGNPTPITVDAQAVPTSVAIGPDGALYVGLLRGAPSDPGTADIYRVVPGHQPEIWADGLTSVTAIAFDCQGRLLATEFNTGGLLSPPTVPGALVRISDNGQIVTTMPVSGLYQPTGVAVSADGTVYVSNYGDSTAVSSQPGEIVKITGLS